MIEHIKTKGFKGSDIDEAVPGKVIYTGDNKSWKSTRAEAISIVLCGYIPFSTAGKTPRSVLESFGQDSFTVVATIKGNKFGRKFLRNEAGKVSMILQYNEKRTSAENFAGMLERAGAPKIADIAKFMKESESKKIDTLFDLYPNPELAGIDSEIEDAKWDISGIEKKIKGAESTVVRLTNSKQYITIPAGSIAETKDEIKTTETKISDLEEQIKQAEIEAVKVEAKAEAKEELKKEVAEKQIDPVDALISKGEQQIKDFKSGGHAFIDGGCPEVEDRFRSVNSGSGVFEDTPGKLVTLNEGDSIQCIIEALTDVGCGTCAALIVAKQEMKKFKGVS